ncbi:MAG: hypothetical protein KA383_16835, partial [Phycisphaerae bacterium]|nr:hypothetical protein [Phycisphaerae bacterium]
MKKLGLLCTLLLASSLALGQEAVISNVEAAEAGAAALHPSTTPGAGALGFVADDIDALGVPLLEGSVLADRAGEDCPAGSLCGQDAGGCAGTQWYFYTDLQFCSGAQCQRVRCENFPPPGVTINKPVGIITWRGVYVDDATNGCTKPQHLFRIRFYTDNAGAPNTAAPFYTEVLTAAAVDTGQTVTFATVPAILWEFTAVLTTPVNLTTGWFSICGDGTPGCYHLWQGSPEGDNKFYQWFEVGGTIPGPAVTDKCDLEYCFGEKIVGACCDDRTAECLNNSSLQYCEAIGGRFIQNGTCSQFSPACGLALGACCYDDGNCQEVIFAECEQTAPPICYGDLNCDGQVSFADINPFVLYLSNNPVWVVTYPGCDPQNGDINGDNTFPSFGDINAFVTLLSTNSLPIICDTLRAGDPYWAGPGTTCAPWPTGGCCTVVVPPGAVLENEPDDCAPDVFNGGCNLDTPLFSPITIGTTVYGEVATFDNTRDMDWYRFTVGGASPVTISVAVEAEFDPVIFLIREGPAGANDCDGSRDVAAPVSGTKCVLTTLTSRCVPPGTYYAVVAPATFSGIRCAEDYKVTVTTAGCEPCTLPPCPAGSYLENSTCDQDPDPNGGCNSTPYAFETLPYTLGTPFTVCGTIWAN